MSFCCTWNNIYQDKNNPFHSITCKVILGRYKPTFPNIDKWDFEGLDWKDFCRPDKMNFH